MIQRSSFLVLAALLTTVPGLGQAAEPKMPAELTRLQEAYDAETTRTTLPVNQRYLDALGRLKDSYIKTREPDKAMLVQKEMDQVTRRMAPLRRLGDKDIEGTQWLWGNGKILTFEKKNVASNNDWPRPGVWERSGDFSVTVQNANGSSQTIVFGDRNLTHAVATSETGQVTAIVRMAE